MPDQDTGSDRRSRTRLNAQRVEQLDGRCGAARADTSGREVDAEPNASDANSAAAAPEPATTDLERATVVGGRVSSREATDTAAAGDNNPDRVRLHLVAADERFGTPRERAANPNPSPPDLIA